MRWAVAACAFTVAALFGWQQWPEDMPVELAMIRHVGEGMDELADDRGVDFSVLHASVQVLGIDVRDTGRRIRHLANCIVDGREGRHFTVDGPRGVVSFLILPAAGAPMLEGAQSGNLRGVFTRRRDIVVGIFGPVGMEPQELSRLMNEVLS